jgi:hypothetical protein
MRQNEAAVTKSFLMVSKTAPENLARNVPAHGHLSRNHGVYNFIKLKFASEAIIVKRYRTIVCARHLRSHGISFSEAFIY